MRLMKLVLNQPVVSLYKGRWGGEIDVTNTLLEDETDETSP